jgi:predicted alpha-1,6-mannanase (GH76 family)
VRRLLSATCVAHLALFVGAGCASTPSGGAPTDAAAGTDAQDAATGDGGDGGAIDSATPQPDVAAGDSASVEASSDAAPAEGGTADADAGPPANVGPGGDFRSYADSIAAALQAMYDPTNANWPFPSTGWWNSANDLTALVDYSARTHTTTYVGDIATIFARYSGSNYLNSFYDDEGWWALAWIDAYDLTQNQQYLAMAQTIFADMTGGWDSTCNGGIWWSKSKTYKNAIANELFLEVAIRLHARTADDGGTGGYLDWATREWNWFGGTGMINTQSLVNDGLTSACANNGQTAWTYNQGVLIGGLVDMARETSQPNLLGEAQAIADAAIQNLVDVNGVLHEPCEPNCGGDGPQFKGIFMRHLAELAAATSAPRYRAFLAKNADWIWNAARGGTGAQIGVSWSGPFDSADGARQGSALDAVNAAIPYSDPQANEALFKTATANGTCAANQSAAQAFDGTVLTKWCAGATNNAYWLEVDLGSASPVGRIVVRHAGAGGESQAWNTRDFTLSTSSDMATWSPFASVTGNTQPVTIHYATPAQARYVRLDITNAQTDPNTVAARIDELEVYGR